jgi:protein-disulfide isomerase
VLASSPLALALSLLLVGGAATTLAFFPREGEVAAVADSPEVAAERQSDLERMMASAPRATLPVPADGAKVLVVKFHDFQCPACGKAYLAYEPIFAKYAASHPGGVRVVAMDFPLDGECNSAVTSMLHPAACEAAVAVRLAKGHARAEILEDWFFRNQSGMTPESVRQAAREVGQVTDFDARYEATLEGVRSDISLGLELGVNSTPTYFINGVKIEGAMAPQYFDQAIAYELARASQ